MDELKTGATAETLKTKIVNLCVEFNLSTKEVCSGIVEVFGPTVLSAVKKSHLSRWDDQYILNYCCLYPCKKSRQLEMGYYVIVQDRCEI